VISQATSRCSLRSHGLPLLDSTASKAFTR